MRAARAACVCPLIWIAVSARRTARRTARVRSGRMGPLRAPLDNSNLGRSQPEIHHEGHQANEGHEHLECLDLRGHRALRGSVGRDRSVAKLLTDQLGWIRAGLRTD